MARLLFVDDDLVLFELTANYLREHGFDARSAPDAAAALALLAAEDWDLVILDVMLPGMDGFEVLRRLRAGARGADVPVLMLTARGSEDDRVSGLDLGADDYLAKPFAPRELVARLRALLRRRPAASGEEAADLWRAGDLTVNRASLAVSGGGGLAATLSHPEWRLLETLGRTPGAVVARDELYRRVFGHAAYAYDRSLDMMVSRLRRKLGPRPDGGERLRAVWGEGYVFLATGAGK